MLAKHLRLRRSEDFQRLREHGKQWRGKLLTLNVMANNLSHNRFGFVVSRRVGNAVTRNRVKRRLRAAVQARRTTLSGGYDVVIVAHPPAADASFHDLDARLKALLEKAGLLVNIGEPVENDDLL